MTAPEVTAESFGREVLGPIVAEFCLRLWSVGSLLPEPSETAMLFCARGGLRIQLAFDRFLESTQLPFPVHTASFMVSRAVAIRPSLMRTVDEGRAELLPWAASALTYEFARQTVGTTARALAGVGPGSDDPKWNQRLTPAGFAELLRHPDGAPVVGALDQQSRLFLRHLDEALDGRPRAVLVDTGLYGTTQKLLAEGVPGVALGSALIARSYRPGPASTGPGTVGLSVESAGYSPLRRRSTILRYWHFVEWLFEPELMSVDSFTDDGGTIRSNLEVDGWVDRIAPTPATAYAGVLAYLGGLGPAPAAQVISDADRAWGAYHRAVVWPTAEHGDALAVGTRSHGFGIDGTWTARAWRGPAAALRGSTMWREGEIARARTPLRLPLLAAIEAGYRARHVKRSLMAVARRK